MHEMNLGKIDNSVASRGMQAYQTAQLDKVRNDIYRLPVAELGDTEEEFELNRIVVLGYN